MRIDQNIISPFIYTNSNYKRAGTRRNPGYNSGSWIYSNSGTQRRKCSKPIAIGNNSVRWRRRIRHYGVSFGAAIVGFTKLVSKYVAIRIGSAEIKREIPVLANQ